MTGDIVPSVPWRWVPTINHDGPRQRTLGVFIHSTRGPTVQASGESLDDCLHREYLATVRYCAGKNPSNVGPHFVVGSREVTRMVHDVEVGYCQTIDNDTHLGIEVCQPAFLPPFTEFQYEATADICAKLARAFGFPAEYIGRQTTENVERPGILGHEDAKSGWSRGKTDPGDKWDWPAFMARVRMRMEIGDPFEGVGSGIVAYCKERGLLPNRRAKAWHYWDADGDEVLKTDTGAWVIARKYLNYKIAEARWE